MSIFDIPPAPRRFSVGARALERRPTFDDLIADQEDQGPTQDEIDAALGLTPPTPEDIPQEEFQQSPGSRFLENFGDVYQGPSVQPNTFLSGLLFGAAGGLAGRGKRIAKERAKFEAAAEKRSEDSRKRNLEASRAYNEARSKGRAALSAEKRSEEAKIRAEQRGEDQDIRKYEREEPRRTATAERAAESADRANRNAERQTKLASATTLNQLGDDYRVDPDISAFRTARQNLQTIDKALELKTGFGDLAALIGYVRATEPGVLSVVRQEELQNVQDAVGSLSRYVNIPKQWVSGQRLTEPGRKQIAAAARTIAQSRRADFDRAAGQYRKRIEALGEDPSLILRDYPQVGSAAGRSAEDLSDKALEAEFNALGGR